jgi:hypothetical protein
VPDLVLPLNGDRESPNVFLRYCARILLAFLQTPSTSSFRIFGTEVGAELVKRPFWVITPFMLIFFGLQFISMGLLAELQMRTYHESQEKPIYVIRESRDALVTA